MSTPNPKAVLREITLSPLYQKGKCYNLETEQEDPNGTLCPEYDHCYVSWEEKYFDRDFQEDKWCKGAKFFHTLESAQEFMQELEKQIEK